MDSVAPTQATQNLTDQEIITRVQHGQIELYELLMRRYNTRVYRVVRSILRDDAEAEDVMQEAYVRAYQHLGQFEGRSSFSTWLTRIAVHEALSHLRQLNRYETKDFTEEEPETAPSTNTMTPEVATGSAETRELLEKAILALPLHYRSVLIMRDVEEMSTLDTASALELTEDAVKVRLHRARAMLRKQLFTDIGATSAHAFQFHAVRCERVSRAVMRRIMPQQTPGAN